MKIDLNDPRLTAYALGELDASETVEFEKLLADSPEAQAYVEEIRSLGDTLAAELRAQAAPALGAEQRAAIEERLEPATPRHAAPVADEKPRFWSWLMQPFPVATAATLCLILGVFFVNGLPEMTVQQPRKSETAETLLPSQMIALETSTPGSSPAQPLESKPYGDKLEALLAPSSEMAPAPAPVLQQESGEQLRRTGYMAGTDLSTVLGPQEKVNEALSKQLPLGVQPDFYVSLSESGPWNRGRAELRQSGEANFMWYGGSAPGVPAQEQSFDHLSVATNAEGYAEITDNPFKRSVDEPLSTFSIDVDTASYSNIRRFLNLGQNPPKDAVRIEEMVNYFPYSYTPPTGEHPFSVHVETAQCPWNTQHRLMKVGLKGREVAAAEREAANLVFLIDVSGSMQDENKLSLVKQALNLLVNKLRDDDRVAIVTYAGNSGLALPSTPCENRQQIASLIDGLESGGSTAGAAGIQLAYQVAQEHFVKGGVNRVLLATDGDFNVGITDQNQLIQLITEKAKSGVFLSVFGFGMGNLKDDTLESLADKGNGNYAYIDNLQEARKAFVSQADGTLVTIAKDVKIQVEFNPARVGAYRLIGYENRILAAEDFNDDKKDAGEIGAGHTVTALYELVPTGVAINTAGVDPLKYQQVEPPAAPVATVDSPESLTVKLRYKQPDGDVSTLLDVPVIDSGEGFQSASTDFKFASAVAGFGMCLRESPHKGTANLDWVIETSRGSRGDDPEGYRAEFVRLAEMAKAIAPQQ